ncbi:hypothetical protein HYH03_008695 [Edaphochlamys debaryana]|uniref:Uncharacterized protein n=1 Tax=Edaphochlamys debaryana TaxID=47281 RepID=A0A836BYJ4_9CHLO|nr:hypothetical protein HYH03_008695 [Edaphochlamys debaryana]|eukprot:KAG2493032.1 hypothetical protein HYH03_008695 [Edaphochlamys debaryana]
MGAGASSRGGETRFAVDPGEAYDPERLDKLSARSRELNILGGTLRPPVKRGDTQRALLEWLQDALREQGDRLEEALSKDPLAGRHEIIRQEAVKLARQTGHRKQRFSVLEWQTMKHQDLREKEAREEVTRRMRPRETSTNGNSASTSVRPSYDGRAAPSRAASQYSGVTGGSWDEASSGAEADPEPPARGRRLPVALVLGSADGEGGGMELPAWRLRVARAKRTAMMVISVVLAFRGRKHRSRGLQRLDSLSFLVRSQLGPELASFVEQQAAYRAAKASAESLQVAAEEAWREANYGEGGPEVEGGPEGCLDDLSDPGGLPPLSPHGGGSGDSSLPMSPRVGGGSGGLSAPGGATGLTPTGSGGFGRSMPPPPLRLPTGGMNGGGPVTTGPGSGGALTPTGGGGGGQPTLLRSRALNLTPTLHHMAQAPGFMSPATGSPGSQPPILGSVANSASSAVAPGYSPGSGPAGMPSARGSLSGGPAGSGPSPPSAAASLSGPLPLLSRTAAPSMRTSMASGILDPSLTPEASYSSSKSQPRGSTPGFDGLGRHVLDPAARSEPQIPLPGLAEELSLMSIPDSSDRAAAVRAEAAAAAAEGGLAGGPSGKRWSIPRFFGGVGAGSRRGGPVPLLASDGAGGSTSSPMLGGKRGPKGSLLAEDLNMVSRAASWAGPGPNGPNGAQEGVLRVQGPMSGPNSPSGGSGPGVSPAPPHLPAPPAGIRNPRNRRNSTATYSYGSGPPGHPTRSPSNTFDGSILSASTDAAPWSPGARAPPSRTRGSMQPSAGAAAAALLAAGTGGGAGAGSRPGSTASTPRPGRAYLRASATGETAATVLAGDRDRDRQLSNSGGMGAPPRRAVTSDASTAEQLYLRCQEEVAALDKPLRLMQLYANRANARWAEELLPPPLQQAPPPPGAHAHGPGGAAPGFEPPHVYDASRFSAAVGGAQSSAFKSEATALLRSGRMAVQILAADDHIIGPTGPRPLWSADPWELIASQYPGKASQPERIRSVPLGPRLIMALVAAAEALAGPEAAERLAVVVHCSEAQAEEVAAELRARRFCGLRPDNLVLCVQTRRSGYAWDPARQAFRADPASAPASAGSGYALMQLVWRGEAFTLTDPDAPPSSAASAGADSGGSGASTARSPRPAPGGPPTGAGAGAGPEGGAKGPAGSVPLGRPVLDWLRARGVEWLASRRLRDLSLYAPETALDPEALAYALFLHDSLGANMAVQVEYVDGIQAARAAQSGVVLGPPRLPGVALLRKQTASSLTGVGAGAGSLAGRGAPRRAGALGGPSAGGGGGGSPGAGASPSRGSRLEGGGASAHHFVLDIKIGDTLTPRMTAALNDVRTRFKGRLAVSTRRYLWKLDALRALLTTPAVFHPSIEVAGDLAYLTFDAADLTAAADVGARCVALAGRGSTRALLGPGDIEALLEVIQAQDASGQFRRLVGNSTPAAAAGGLAFRRPQLALSSLALGASAAGGPGGLGPAFSTPVPPSPGAGGGPMLQHSPSLSGAMPSTPTGGGGGSGGLRVVCFVADNDATGMAVRLLMALVRPQRDSVVLVHVASTILQESGARVLLRKFESLLAGAMLDVSTELLTKNANGPLVDQLESYADSVDASLIVMGSQVLAAATPSPALGALSGGGGGLGGGGFPGYSGGSFSGGVSPFAAGGGGGAGGGAITASVALSLLKSTTRPMLIVKANAKHAVVAWDRDPLRCLVEVHHTSRHLLRFAAGRLLLPGRGDKVVLARGGAKDASAQDNVTSRRLLDNFADIAAQHNLSAVKRPMEEPFEAGAVKYADLDRIQIIAMQAPGGRSVPPSVVNVLRAARSGVLVYKSNEPF